MKTMYLIEVFIECDSCSLNRILLHSVKHFFPPWKWVLRA